MFYFIQYLYLFMIGSLIGWTIELFFRRFISTANPERRWINPGFLVGPCLPLYGFGLCALYMLSCLVPDIEGHVVLSYILRFLLMGLAMTGVEFLAGIIFVKALKVKLWDYSKEWGNIGGIICPKFSLIWTAVGILYYFLLHPVAERFLSWMGEQTLALFFAGIYYGILLIDFVYSTNIMAKIRAFAAKDHMVIQWEELKAHILETKEKRREKLRFVFSMSTGSTLHEHLVHYRETLERREEMRRRFIQSHRKDRKD